MGGHQIGRPEPGGQRQLGVVHDGAGGHRGLLAATGAFPGPWLGLQFPGLALAAARADKAFGPARREQVSDAGPLIWKAFLKVNQGTWKIGHGITQRIMFMLCSNMSRHSSPISIVSPDARAEALIADIIVSSIGVPSTLGSADDFGHGTRVGGVAVFGDLRAQLAAGRLNRGARLCSAKVVNNQGDFDDRHLVPTQMREAITTLNRQIGCRIFVIALGDTKRPYDGGKVGTRAATLDELARELDVLIIVSSGNRSPRSGNRLEQAVTEYPRYLLEETNRFFEPAGAMNVLTVGALAHGEGLDSALAEDVRARPITREWEPAPFTRIGPGVGGATKPELVDIGGTLVFDPVTARLRRGEDLASAGVHTLHHAFVDRLFTAGSGTSYSAPRVAFGASDPFEVSSGVCQFDPRPHDRRRGNSRGSARPDAVAGLRGDKGCLRARSSRS